MDFVTTFGSNKGVANFGVDIVVVIVTLIMVSMNCRVGNALS